MGGCESLVETPLTFIVPAQFYKTVADANAVCLSMYPDLFNLEAFWLTDFRSVEANCNDGRMLSYNTLEPLQSDSNLGIAWQSYYKLIRDANTAIDGLEASSLSPLQKNPYIGEAKAMRAYAYLLLVKNWGDVPLILSTFTEGTSIPVTPMKDIYAQIFSDLNDALYVTPISGPGSNPGRLDQAGARMIMADAAVTIAQSALSYKTGGADAAALKPYSDAFGSDISKYFTIAKNQLDTLINKQSFYKLYDGKNGLNWIDMFGRTANGTDQVNNCESIFRTMTIPITYSGGQTTVPSQSNFLPGQSNGSAFVPTYEYVASFDKNDLRRQEGFVWFYQNLNAGSNVVEYHIPFRQFGNEPFDLIDLLGASGSVNPTNGYADYPNSNNGEQWASQTILQTSIGTGGNFKTVQVIRDANYSTPACAKFFDQSYQSGNPAISTPLYRMAEAYLMYAEASAYLYGINQDAVDKLNAIHSRAFSNSSAHTFNLSNFANLAAFNNALVDEYIWEFGFEGKITPVLIRFGKLQERIKQVTSEYVPKFEPGFTGDVLGVEAEWTGQYQTRQRKVRGVDQYWLFYPIAGEEQLNSAMEGLTKMKY